MMPDGKMKSTKELARDLGLLRKRSSSSGTQCLKRMKKNKQEFAYLIVIDFESTCWENIKYKTQEIIEFPAVLLNTATGTIDSEFHHYVQPQENPYLSDFCRQLTGITQEQVDQGIPLFLTLKKFASWLQRLANDWNISYDAFSSHDRKCTFVTWSDWDLGVCLQYEARRKQLRKPAELNSWIDLRATYRNFYQRRPQGLNGALQDLGISFEGREHSGLCDARNTAKLAWRMMTDGCLLRVTKTLTAPLTGRLVPQKSTTSSMVAPGARHETVESTTNPSTVKVPMTGGTIQSLPLMSSKNTSHSNIQEQNLIGPPKLITNPIKLAMPASETVNEDSNIPPENSEIAQCSNKTSLNKDCQNKGRDGSQSDNSVSHPAFSKEKPTSSFTTKTCADQFSNSSGPLRTSVHQQSTVIGLRQTSIHQQSTSSGLQQTSALQKSTSSWLQQTSSHQRSTLSGPLQTSTPQKSTFSGPLQTSSHQRSTSSGPLRTSAYQKSTSSGPLQTSHQRSTSSGPQRTSAPQESTSSGPLQTSAYQKPTSLGLQQTSTDQQSTSTGCLQASSQQHLISDKPVKISSHRPSTSRSVHTSSKQESVYSGPPKTLSNVQQTYSVQQLTVSVARKSPSNPQPTSTGILQIPTNQPSISSNHLQTSYGQLTSYNKQSTCHGVGKSSGELNRNVTSYAVGRNSGIVQGTSFKIYNDPTNRKASTGSSAVNSPADGAVKANTKFKTPSPVAAGSKVSGLFKTPSPVLPLSTCDLISSSYYRESTPFLDTTNNQTMNSSRGMLNSSNTKMKRTPPMCACGRRSHRKLVQSPGPNQGRAFYCCPAGKNNKANNRTFGGAKKQGCGFFKWENAKDPNLSVTANSGSFLNTTRCSSAQNITRTESFVIPPLPQPDFSTPQSVQKMTKDTKNTRKTLGAGEPVPILGQLRC